MSIPVFFPLPSTRKGVKVLMIVLIAVCLVGTVAIYITWSNDQQMLKDEGQPDFNKLAQDELEDGMIVKGDIVFTLDTFAETYEENFGQRTSQGSEELYYVIPVFDHKGYPQYCIAYRAYPEDFEIMEAIWEQSWYETDVLQTLDIDNGVITDLKGDYLTLYQEYLDTPDTEGATVVELCAETNYFGTTDPDEIRARFAPYLLTKTATAGMDINLIFLPLGIMAVCIIILLVVIFRKKPLKGYDPPVDKGFSQLKDEEMNNTL